MENLKEECYAWDFSDTIKYKLQNTNKYITKHGIAGQRLKLLTLTESFIAFFLKTYTGWYSINKDEMKQNTMNIFL